MQQIYRRTPIRNAISIKLCSNFTEIALRHRCSPVNFLYIFRTLFLKSTSAWLLLLFSGAFPDPAHGAHSTRDVLHVHMNGQPMSGYESASVFIDNLRFYDFVLHAKDIRKIYTEGENLKSMDHIILKITVDKNL